MGVRCLLAIAVSASLILSACGGGSGDGDGAGEGEGAAEASSEPAIAPEAPSGPAIVDGGITVNGMGTQGQVGLVPERKSVKLRKTSPFGSFSLTDVKPGSYKLTASVLWEIPPPRPGQKLGPARNKPCRAKGFSVDNVFFQLGSRYAVDATARTNPLLELKPGDRLTLNVKFSCRLRLGEDVP